MRWIVGYLATALSFAAFDFVWLTQVGPKLYKPRLGDLLAAQPDMRPAVLFYVIYTVGFFLLAVTRADSVVRAGLTGALFGFVAYATYDLTNQATLKTWSTTVTVADMAWGTVATAAAASVGYLAWRWANQTFH